MPVEKQVTINRNERKTVSLYPHVPRGTIQVSAKPFGAQIELKGDAGEHYTAIGMKIFKDIPIGTYSLHVHCLNYKDYHEVIKVGEFVNIDKTIHLDLISQTTNRADDDLASLLYTPEEEAGALFEDFTEFKVYPELQKKHNLFEEIAEVESVIDIDGNTYSTVKIGNQIWMAENLRTTYYRNGDPISNVIGMLGWSIIKTGAYCSYNNEKNPNVHGYLYNWYAVNDFRGIAPKGWHVPSEKDWKILLNYLGGRYIASNELKEAGTKYWKSPNTMATDASGFSSLPSGCRNEKGDYNSLGIKTYYWSFNVYRLPDAWAWAWSLDYKLSEFNNKYYLKQNGFSIRCVKD